MITPSELIRLPFTPDLTQVGIAYTCRRLSRSLDAPERSTPGSLHLSVASTASELAFHRYLNVQGIPYKLHQVQVIDDPDRRTLELADRRCEWKCTLITQNSSVRQLGEEPERLLTWPVRAPRYTFLPQSARDDDLLIFVYVTGLVARTFRDIEKARANGQPEYLVHLFPNPTLSLKYWTSLGQLAFQADCQQSVRLELAGLDCDRILQSEEMILAPRRVTHAKKDYFSLAYLHMPRWLNCRVEVSNHYIQHTYSIAPAQWRNIWVYGNDIFLAGFITRREYRYQRHAMIKTPRGEGINHQKTRYLTVSDLHPLEQLLRKARFTP